MILSIIPFNLYIAIKTISNIRRAPRGEPKMENLTLIETRKSRNIQSENYYEEKIPYMQTFRF